jgi:tetratricopeptide (TPR) repeat protein
VFYELSDDILSGLDSDDEEMGELEEELEEILPRCLEQIFPLPDEVDVSFEIGRVAYRMESYELAMEAFLISIEQYGEDARTRFNLGLTWYYRESWEVALKEFENALELKPDYEDAKLWVQKTREKLKSA